MEGLKKNAGAISSWISLATPVAALFWWGSGLVHEHNSLMKDFDELEKTVIEQREATQKLIDRVNNLEFDSEQKPLKDWEPPKNRYQTGK